MRTTGTIRSLVTLLVAGLVLACGGGDTTAPPEPVGVTLSPTTAAVNAGATQNFTATVVNATNAAVTWSANGGTINGSGATATYTAPLDGGPYTVTATSVEDNTKKGTATVTVNAVAVALSPATATIPAGGTQQFTVTVNNASNNAVTWTATGGTIDGTGSTITYTAPATGGSYTVRATSVLDPSKSGTAATTVTSAAVSVTPTAQTVFRGEPVSLTAAVTGAAVTTVDWSATCGTVTGSGATVTWTAPQAAGPCSVTAASSLDPAQAASATMTVTPSWRVSAAGDTDDGACTWTHCSLREALTAANANPDADTIRFGLPAARRVGANVAAAMTMMTLSSALPVITTNVHLIGPGADMLTIDANASQVDQRRVLEFAGALTGSVSGFTLRGGVASGGGGISLSNGSNLALSNVVIRDNDGLGAGGGGILADGSGSITLDNVTLQMNQTSGEGGGARLIGTSGLTGSITNTTITENTAHTAGGLALGNLGSFIVTGTTVSNNTASTRVGGVFLWGNSDVTVTNSTITENVAQGTGGGGGLYTQNTAKATVTNSTINNNRALGLVQNLGGGVVVGGGSTVEMTGGSISGNEVAAGSGGAISTFTGTVKLTDVTVADNKATTVGGGGAIYANGATITIMGGTFNNNVSMVGAGGAMLQDGGTTSIDGTTFMANKNMGGFAGGAISMLNAANLTITGATFDGNQATASAGAIALNNTGTLTVSNSLFTNNSGNFGGALQKSGASTLSITNSTFSNNTAAMQSGALHLLVGGSVTLQRVTVSNNTSQTGGGGLTSGGVLTMDNSTISGNSTGAAATGGGMFLSSTGTSTITNTTISGNSAQIGGGIGTTGNATLKNLTIVGNTATSFGGGIASNNNGITTYSNSLLSGNLVNGGPGNCGAGGAGQVNSAGFNLSSDGSCGPPARVVGATVALQIVTQPSDRHNTAAGVSPTLAANGGATMTHALTEGSAAINGANPATCPTTDQRGASRVGACDNGAFEFGGTVPAGGRGGLAPTSNRRRSGGGG